jgi:predicted NBD/HSP70 family sugar kinase
MEDQFGLQAANSETARLINRRIVLNLIRSRQPISRADVARLSGLQRSTVSLITEELIKDRWVTEGATGRLPRGRRPTFLQLNEQLRIIAVDVRPVHTRLALCDVNARMLEQQLWTTPKESKAAMQELCRRMRRLMAAHEQYSFEGVGVSVAGRIDPETQALAFAPNLKWRGVDLRTPIERATGLDVAIENAANACALTEVWFGSHQGVRDLVVITVSEGIGCGILANGQLLRGNGGMAGEFGHSVVDPDGPRCTCGNRGCWEIYASNTAAVRFYSGGEGTETTFEDLLALAGKQDVRALQALQHMAQWLGQGAARLVNGFAPAALVFVGELTRAWGLFRPAIEKEITRYALGPEPVRVLASDDGEMARLRGTVALVLQRHFGTPSFI